MTKSEDVRIMIDGTDTIEITITGLGHEGEGVGRTSDFVVFVPGALPGEEVCAKIAERKKTFCRAELVRILKPSADRITPACPYFGTCGGCNLQHMEYRAQLDFKAQRVKDAISRIGRADPGLVRPCTGMENPWEYRNNIQYTVSSGKDWYRIGLLARQSHDMIPVDRCLLVPEDMDRLAREVCGLAWEMRPRSSSTAGFPITRVQVRKSWATDALMAIIYTDKISLERGPEVAKKIIAGCPACIGVINLVKDSRDRVEREIVLSGNNRITEQLDGLSFQVQAQSFFQVNTRQAETLYKLAVSMAAGVGIRAVDAYCGTGGLSLFFARTGIDVTGIESNPEAIADAIENSRLNNLGNASFRRGTFAGVFPGIAKALKPGLLIVDPPRNGIGRDDIAGLGDTTIEKILYVSCDPGTLARDITLLRAFGFSPDAVTPVDMFPQTAHVETVTLFRKNS